MEQSREERKKEKMRVAMLQTGGGIQNPETNMKLLEEKANHAASVEQCDLLVTPEVFLTGYGGLSFESPLKYLPSAETIEGPNIVAAQQIARKYNIAILFNFPELCNKVGSNVSSFEPIVYNTCILIDKDGEIICHYRKTHLYGNYEKSVFSPGHEFAPIVQLKGINIQIGLLICWDIEMPEPARILTLRGAQVILCPTANGTGFVPMHTVPCRAFENHVFVVYANRCGREKDHGFCGQSVICAPDGRDLCKAGIRDQVMLVAELDMKEEEYMKKDVDNHFHQDRRVELYRDLLSEELKKARSEEKNQLVTDWQIRKQEKKKLKQQQKIGK